MPTLLEFLLFLYLFAIGATLGSFLHVVAVRFPIKRSFSGTARSSCPHCDTRLSWRELIPLVSFLIQKGRCLSCHKPIASRYLIVEIVVGVLFVLLIWPTLSSSTFSAQTALLLGVKTLILSALIILFIIDADTFLLPDPFILLLLLGVVMHLLATMELTQLGPYLGLLVGSGFLGFLYLVTRGQGLGLGDVKLMAPLGLLFGPVNTALLLFIAFGSGAVVALYLLVTKQATRKTAIPFGPYLCAAAALLLLFPQASGSALRLLGYI